MKPAKRILFLYYSFSSQAKNLLQGLATGLEEQGVEVCWERIEPVDPPRFPLGSVSATIWMMVATFFRHRLAIHPPSQQCRQQWDLIILAGPTWSYNPSGPILSLLDGHGVGIFSQSRVKPLITCRGYWRTHWWYLRRRLRRMGAEVQGPLVFTHLNPEPWRTVGVFLKLAGKMPERTPLISRYYSKYGHTRSQITRAEELGRCMGSALVKGESPGGAVIVDR